MRIDLFKAASIFLAAFFVPAISSAAELATEHTYKLEAGEARPLATLQDAAWLAGSWEGTAFGQKFEEVWNAPSVGSMVGMFKLHDGNAPSFYEILLLTEIENSLSLRVRHFNPDFSAWENKDEFIDFRLVKLEDNALHFRGISFYRISEDLIDAYIVFKSDAGPVEHKLVYQRSKPEGVIKP